MKSKIFWITLLSLGLAACDRPQAPPPAVVSNCGTPPTDAASASSPKQDKATADSHLSEKMGNIKTTGDVGAVVQLLSWNLCNARSNGWIDDNFYRTEFVALQEGAFHRLGIPDQKSPSSADSESTPSSAPSPGAPGQ